MKNFFNKSLSIVVPVYNEEEIIEYCIRNSFEKVKRYFSDTEIIIVDDGSNDQTPKILKKLTKEFSNLKVLTNAKNSGIGKSLLSGLKYAQNDFIIHNGADSPYDYNGLDELIPNLEQNDIIVLTRNNHTGYTLYRKVVSLINRSLLRLFFPLRLIDFNFVQIYKREVIQDITPTARSAGFLIPEILISAFDSGFKIKELKSEYQARTTGKASAGKITILIHSLYDMIAFYIKRKIRIHL